MSISIGYKDLLLGGWYNYKKQIINVTVPAITTGFIWYFSGMTAAVAQIGVHLAARKYFASRTVAPVKPIPTLPLKAIPQVGPRSLDASSLIHSRDLPVIVGQEKITAPLKMILKSDSILSKLMGSIAGRINEDDLFSDAIDQTWFKGIEISDKKREALFKLIQIVRGDQPLTKANLTDLWGHLKVLRQGGFPDRIDSNKASQLLDILSLYVCLNQSQQLGSFLIGEEVRGLDSQADSYAIIKSWFDLIGSPDLKGFEFDPAQQEGFRSELRRMDLPCGPEFIVLKNSAAAHEMPSPFELEGAFFRGSQPAYYVMGDEVFQHVHLYQKAVKPAPVPPPAPKKGNCAVM